MDTAVCQQQVLTKSRRQIKMVLIMESIVLTVSLMKGNKFKVFTFSYLLCATKCICKKITIKTLKASVCLSSCCSSESAFIFLLIARPFFREHCITCNYRPWIGVCVCALQLFALTIFFLNYVNLACTSLPQELSEARLLKDTHLFTKTK